jgi:hypothetical protein
MRRLLRTYWAALREEPKIGAYLAGALVDDVGVAVSAWGMTILAARLFTDQGERARLVLPTMVCFLAGTLLAGPLADWGARTFPAGLPRWRWRIVVYARLVETAALGAAVWGARGTPTIGRMLPYYMISAFMKTALRPTRIAFGVDLLRREAIQTDGQGHEVLDERGQPRPYKVHLLAFESMTSALSNAAVLGGFLLGGKILAAAGGRYTPLFVIDVGTNIVFILAVVLGCHPDKRGSEVRLADLWRSPAGRSAAPSASVRAALGDAVRELGASFRDAGRFLAHPDQRMLLWLLFGAWIFEVVNEFYDGPMILKQVLHGSDDAVRHAIIVWKMVSLATVMLLPMVARRVGSIGKIFLVTAFLDGIALIVAGRFCAALAFAPCVAVFCADQALTSTSQTLIDLAQNSASSAAMRGRLAAAYALVVILSDMGAEVVATWTAERIGIAAMLVWLGVVQALLIGVVALVGGRKLWSFGIRTADETRVAVDPMPSGKAASGAAARH